MHGCLKMFQIDKNKSGMRYPVKIWYCIQKQMGTDGSTGEPSPGIGVRLELFGLWPLEHLGIEFKCFAAMRETNQVRV